MHEYEYDLCIIGAGLFGSAAARHATTDGNQKICLIGLDEPMDEELMKRDIFSSHYDAGRIVKHLFASPAFQKLARASISRLQDLKNISEMQFFEPVGFLQIGKKGSRVMSNLEDISAAVDTQLFHISNKKIDSIFSFMKLQHGEYALLDFSGAGIIRLRELLEAQRKIAVQQGCKIIFDKVEEVEPLKNNFHTISTTNHGCIKSRRVLFTTGAFMNVNEFKIVPQLEIYPYKELAAMIRVPHSEAERLRAMPGLDYNRDDNDVGSYILPPVMYPDGRYYLKVGSLAYDSGKGMQTKEEIKNWFFTEENPEEVDSIARVLFQIIPDLISDGIFGKVCVTCETPTKLPYVDQVTSTITLAVAGNGWGATISDEIGRLAAHLSLTGIWDSELPKSLFELVLKE